MARSLYVCGVIAVLVKEAAARPVVKLEALSKLSGDCGGELWETHKQAARSAVLPPHPPSYLPLAVLVLKVFVLHGSVDVSLSLTSTGAKIEV